MGIINLGILAHVDAGKTSLTERILFEAGVIASIGSVDRGDTQTDTLELERQRGITIQSTVVSFPLNGHKVNLIDTPGHADFIAEVERSLSVLDGVILVVSAVEGVQPQTRRLARAIHSLGLPLIVFINKVDRMAARGDALLDELRLAIQLPVVPVTEVLDPGTVAAEVVVREPCPGGDPAELMDLLAERNDLLIADYLATGLRPQPDRLLREFRRQARAGLIVPVFFGSAITGAGTDLLLLDLPRLLPTAAEREREPLSAVVFKIQRTQSGEKLVLARIYAGRVGVRDHVNLRRPTMDGATEEISQRVTGLDLYHEGHTLRASAAAAGDIARLHGLAEAQIGDVLGVPPPRSMAKLFTRPTLESVIHPGRPGDAPALSAALLRLAEQDPLIDVALNERLGLLSVRLYGEVQKEVIASTLASDFGLSVTFEPSNVICIETVVGSGHALEVMGGEDNPFAATIGLTVRPMVAGSGVVFQRESGALPLAFYRAVEETVGLTLREGLHGWAVTDCIVYLGETAYSSPVSVAADFRKLTPLVLMEATGAETVVNQPVQRFTIDAPEDCASQILAALMMARIVLEATVPWQGSCRITGRIPTIEVPGFERQVPRLSRGEGVFFSEAEGYAPVHGGPPSRPRTDCNPLNRKQYLALVSQT